MGPPQNGPIYQYKLVRIWKDLESKYDEIIEIRGAGLLLGIKTKKSNIEVNKCLLKNKLLTVIASDNIIRLAPPLIVEKQDIDKALNIIDKTFKELND